MGRVDDEELVFHVGERFVVHDLVEETLLSLTGQLLDRGSPSFESSLVEGIWE
jgi:hypothetical protein